MYVVVKQEINYDRVGNETTTYMYYIDGSKNLARDAKNERAVTKKFERDYANEKAKSMPSENGRKSFDRSESSSTKDLLKKILGQ